MLNNQSFARSAAFIVLSFLLVSLSPAGHAAGEQRYYDIEIVLFQNSAALKDLPELINKPQLLQLPEQYIQLGMPIITESTDFIPEFYFKLLPETDYQLREAAEKIASTKAYRIIKHFAWRQPGLSKEVAIPIVFQDEIAAEIPEALPETDTPAPLLYTQAQLEGVMKVSLSRYLHLESELRFEARGLAPLPDASNEVVAVEDAPTIRPRPTTVVYYEKQKRRMRSKELHYIDHPVIGMLVLMTPVEIPKLQEPVTKIMR